MEKHGLQLRKPQYENTLEVFIEGDENDGDYVSLTSHINFEDIPEVYPVLKKLYKNKHIDYSWENREQFFTADDIDVLENFGLIPCPNQDGADIHTIEDVKVWFLCAEDNIRYEVKL